MHRSGSEELGVAQFASTMSVPQDGQWNARFNTFPMASSLPSPSPLLVRCECHTLQQHALYLGPCSRHFVR